MDWMPSNIMFDILSRCPVKSLVPFRCVSKLWCKYVDDFYLAKIHGERFTEEPTPIMFHYTKRHRSLCFHTVVQSGTTDHVFRPKKDPDFEFVHKKPPSRILFQGSCNGLVFISEDDAQVITNLTVIHPIKKQCYELPPLPFSLDCHMSRGSCGLCFDSSTNTLKMVCVSLNGIPRSRDPDLVRKNLHTLVHVFGTNSWQEIPQVPSDPIRDTAVSANGCLHWFAVFHETPTVDNGKRVVWFDVKKEEFGLINPPKTISTRPNREFCSCLSDQLVNLNGQVGYFCNTTMEVWVLNHKKEWVLLCQIDDQEFPRGYLKVLGCVNKDGDILIRYTKQDAGKVLFFIYNLKNSVLHESHIIGRGEGYKTDIVMFPNSLFSFHNITTNSSSIKNTCRQKRCCGKF